jgi:hypothetical protein
MEGDLLFVQLGFGCGIKVRLFSSVEMDLYRQ